MNIADITGTWKVKRTATGGDQVPPGSEWTVFIKASQAGTIVSGVFTTAHGLSGKISGNVLGDAVSMRIDQGPDCPGSFHGVAKVHASNDMMAGTYSGADTAGTLQASFIACRMNYYAVVLNRIKTKIYFSEEDKRVLWHSALPAILPLIAILFSLRFIDRIIPNFRAFLILAIVLIFGLCGLYQLLKGK